jgi:hypothetical protein
MPDPLHINLVRAARAYAALHAQLPPKARILGDVPPRADIVTWRHTEALRSAIRTAWGRDDAAEMGGFIRGVR